MERKTMRLILTTIILILFSQPVWAMSNEILYKNCRVYADNNFSLSSEDYPDWPDYTDAVVCAAYIRATIDAANFICLFSEDRFTKRIWGASADNDDLNAVAQSFLNHAKANPAQWEYIPYYPEWLSNNFPCDK
jgi:hypothetical protein